VRTLAVIAAIAISLPAADVNNAPTIAPGQLRNANFRYLSSYNVRIPHGNATLSNWPLSHAILIKRVQISAQTVFLNYDNVTRTYSPCASPTPQLMLSNGVTSVAYRLPNLPVTTKRPSATELTGSTDSGSVSVLFPAGAPISMKIIYNKITCNTLASQFNINVQYTALLK